MWLVNCVYFTNGRLHSSLPGDNWSFWRVTTSTDDFDGNELCDCLDDNNEPMNLEDEYNIIMMILKGIG